jgi:HD-like signal output (HDOD) protein
MLAFINVDSKTFIHKKCTLPALPELVYTIQGLIHSEDVNIAKVADLVSEDPELAAKVLTVVNSVYYGLPKEVSSLNSALSILGLNEIYRIVLTLSIIDTIAISQEKELNEFWFHSFYCALCAKYLAQRYEPGLPLDILWASAMLHDLGKLVYLKLFPDHYKALKGVCEEHSMLFSEAERHMSLPASAYLGTLLCDQWRLPRNIRHACEFHTLADLSAIDRKSFLQKLERVICLGNLIALVSSNGVDSQKRRQLRNGIRSALGCSEAEITTMMEDISGLSVEVERFLDDLARVSESARA